jgi:predicted HD phosphohydrolase
VSELFRHQVLVASRAARDRVAAQIIPAALLLQIQALLADYRHH